MTNAHQFLLISGTRQRHCEVNETGREHPCVWCGFEGILHLDGVWMCLFCALCVTYYNRDPKKTSRTHPLNFLDVYEDVIMDPGYIELVSLDRILISRELELVERVLGREKVFEILEKFTGSRQVDIPFPRVLPDIRRRYHIAEVMRTGVYYYRTGSVGGLIIRYPFANGLNINIKTLIRRFQPSELLVRFASSETWEKGVLAGYTPGSRAIDVREHKEENRKIRKLIVTEDFEATREGELLPYILSEAYFRGSTDVHIQPVFISHEGRYLDEVRTRVSLRIDGQLHTLFERSGTLEGLFVSIRNEAGVNTTVRPPLDLAFPMEVKKGDQRETVFCRVSIGPVHDSAGRRYENAVIRLLDTKIIYRSPEELGYTGPAARRFFDIVMESGLHGIVIIAGPTGTGKSTTLHVVLRELHKRWPRLAYRSIEHPVEYRQDFLVQYEVDETNPNTTFAGYCRMMMRQDPDVILIGEVRDTDTARAAFNMAITGHLVLTTIHAENIPRILTRLSGLGVDQNDILEGLSALVTQKLVRRPCPQCLEFVAVEDLIRPRYVEFIKKSGVDIPERLPVGRGCNECFHGFSGRICVMETARVGHALRDTVLEYPYVSIPFREFIQAIVRDGYTPMLQDASVKAREGRVDGREFRQLVLESQSILQVLHHVRGGMHVSGHHH